MTWVPKCATLHRKLHHLHSWYDCGWRATVGINGAACKQCWTYATSTELYCMLLVKCVPINYKPLPFNVAFQMIRLFIPAFSLGQLWLTSSNSGLPVGGWIGPVVRNWFARGSSRSVSLMSPGIIQEQHWSGSTKASSFTKEAALLMHFWRLLARSLI